MMLALADAQAGSRAIFLTASGSGAMEAAVINSVGRDERALVIVGGSFGERFREICVENEISHDCIRLDPGVTLHHDEIDRLDLRRYKALLINAHETSTGVLYDLMRLG